MNKIDFLGIIPARKGSKRLPNKNLAILNKKPLIGWTIEAALRSKLASNVLVTSDSDEILSYSASMGIELLHKRRKELADDVATSESVVLDVLKNYEVENIVLLQPTSPLRNFTHINKAIEFFKRCKSNIVSISKITKSSDSKFPIFFNQDTKELKLQRDLKRCQPSFQLNGAIYIFSSKSFKTDKKFINDQTFGFLMSDKHSIDIDTELDFIIAENLFKNLNKNNHQT